MSDETVARLRALAEDLIGRSIGRSWLDPWAFGDPMVPISLVALRHLVHSAVERGYGIGLLRAAEVDA